MKFRMIALDVDGTLIDDHFMIQPKTKALLKALHDQGVEIALCTGRNPSGAIPLMEEMGITGPVVTHNGAFSLHSSTREIYGVLGFQMAELKEIVNFCRERNIHFDVNTPLHLYVEKMDDALASLYQAYFAEPILLDDIFTLNEEVVKFTLVAEENVIDDLVDEVRERFPQFHSIRSGENYIDLMHPKASKGYGLQIVTEKLGIPLNKVIAFGNYYNDIEMLQEVGLGIAMENSPPEVKKAAGAVTRSNNEEGIYYGLKEHFFESEEQVQFALKKLPQASIQWNG